MARDYKESSARIESPNADGRRCRANTEVNVANHGKPSRRRWEGECTKKKVARRIWQLGQMQNMKEETKHRHARAADEAK